ncbi:MAG: CRTAC1 family protein [Pseudomonadales bacterium]|nr:CRTAC1 family protein [Pseudomonadales bacterium]
MAATTVRNRLSRYRQAAHRGLTTLLIVGLAACSEQPTVAVDSSSDAWFSEEAAVRGITFHHQTGFAGRHLLPEIVGSGAALADFDGDGDLDAYLVQSGSLYDLEPGVEQPANRLYINRGDGSFEEAENAHGADDRGYGMGVAAGDYDNDGDIDLFVTNVGPNTLYRNDGHGNFEDVSAQAGLNDPGWGTAAAFVDLDGDRDLDLFHANYINWSEVTELQCFISGVPTYCPPQNYQSAAVDRLFRNNGDGSFTDVSLEVGLNRAFGNGFGVVTGDFDGDGNIDIFVANDMMVNQLWLNRGSFQFDEEAMLRGVAVDEYGVAKAGMGVASGDIDDDGDIDLLVVNLQGQTDSFFRNEGDYFADATSALGLASSSRRYTRWGVVLTDFDNDGRLDLYEANGRVDPSTAYTNDLRAEPNVLFRGTSSGKFVEIDPKGGTKQPLIHSSRGTAVGDVDNDGGLDLLVVNRDGPAYLLMNRVPNRGNWIRFKVLSREGRDAYGALVTAMVGPNEINRRVQPEGSYLDSNDPRVHFGLGHELQVHKVEVLWPSGEIEAFGDFDAGYIVYLREGEGTALRQ